MKSLSKVVTPKGRPCYIPAASCVSPADPSILIDRDTALQIYNYAHHPAKAHLRLDQTVQEWFRSESISLGWSFVAFPLVMNTRSNRAGVCLVVVPG